MGDNLQDRLNASVEAFLAEQYEGGSLWACVSEACRVYAAAPQQAPAAPSPDVEAQALAARIGLRYAADEKCRMGAPFYAFTEGELDQFAAALRQQPAPPKPAPGEGLLPLPEPLKEVLVAGYHDSALKDALEDYFDADQMRAYAKQHQQPVQAAPGAVAEAGNDGSIMWLTTKPVKAGTKLYAAPNPPTEAAPGAVGDVEALLAEAVEVGTLCNLSAEHLMEVGQVATADAMSKGAMTILKLSRAPMKEAK